MAFAFYLKCLRNEGIQFRCFLFENWSHVFYTKCSISNAPTFTMLKIFEMPHFPLFQNQMRKMWNFEYFEHRKWFSNKNT